MFSLFKRRSARAAEAAESSKAAGVQEPAAQLPTEHSPPSAGAASQTGYPGEERGLDVGALLEPPAAPADQPSIGAADPARTEALKPRIVDAVSTVFDPEIPVNIYALGLIYDISVDAESRVGIRMTLTSPACPSAQQLPSEVRWKVKALDGVSDCAVEIVWEPPWTKEMMSEEAKLSLGFL
jgi:FeS assembly SUF system protein